MRSYKWNLMILYRAEIRKNVSSLQIPGVKRCGEWTKCDTEIFWEFWEFWELNSVVVACY